MRSLTCTWLTSVACVVLVLVATCASASPVLLFGPTTDLHNSSGVDSDAIAAQLVGLTTDPSSWPQLRNLLQSSNGALHMRHAVFVYMSDSQAKTFAMSTNALDLAISVESGGSVCGTGSGVKAANSSLASMQSFLSAGGRVKYLALESMFSRTHAGCPQQSHQTTAEEIADYAAVFRAALTVDGKGPTFVLYDALPHFRVKLGDGPVWPANVASYNMDLGTILKLLQTSMKTRGVKLSGYWADCPRDYSENGAYPNTTHPYPDGSGYKKIGAAVGLVKSMGLDVGKTFNYQSGGMSGDQAFFQGTVADWESAASVIPGPASDGHSLDYVMVESWYFHPLKAAPETQAWTTAFTALNVLTKAHNQAD